MFIRVDLPAPFSPISPCTDPRATASETARFACTGPKCLSIARSSRAAPEGRSTAWIAGRSGSTGLRRLVFGNGHLARDDVGLGLVEARLHLRGNQFPVVVVERLANAVLGQAEDLRPRLPVSILCVREHRPDRDVDALEGRGEDAAGMQVVLVAVAADAQEPGVRRRLHDPDAGRPGGMKD